MRRLSILAAAAMFASPALAQHQGHAMPMPPASAEPAPPETPVEPEPDPHAGHRMEAEQPDDPHAGHAMPESDPDPHAGHAMPEMEPDPHGGHAMPATEPDPHAGHAMPEMNRDPAPPVAPPPPEAFEGPEHAAETVFDPALFRRKREETLIEEHGGFVTWMILADRLEYRAQDGGDGYAWEGEGWYGSDYHRLRLESEGEGAFGESPERAEVQALYSRPIDPWWNVQLGVRHDFRPDPERTHLVLGIQGLAPYWFEVDGSLFLSDEGELTARIEAEYDQRITNRLILQPAIEIDLAAQDAPEIGIGAGLSSVEAGLRLRYEIVPEFAPYIGVEYERSFGDTADFRRAEGGDVGGWNFLLGVRMWF